MKLLSGVTPSQVNPPHMRGEHIMGKSIDDIAKIMGMEVPAGVDVSDADAAEADVIYPKTFYSVAAPRKTGTYKWGASDTVRNANDSDKSTTSTTWVKVKETRLDTAFVGSIRITWHIGTSKTVYCYGRLYRNGVALGSEYGTSGSKSIKEDFTDIDWAVNDLLQIYLKAGTDVTVHASNFQLCYDMLRSSISTTNQDP